MASTKLDTSRPTCAVCAAGGGTTPAEWEIGGKGWSVRLCDLHRATAEAGKADLGSVRISRIDSGTVAAVVVVLAFLFAPGCSAQPSRAEMAVWGIALLLIVGAAVVLACWLESGEEGK